MSSISNRKHVQEYVYDFDVEGGGNGANIELSAEDGVSPIPVGAIITDVTARVITDIVGTSSTCSWGNDDDEDGYSGTTIAEATLVANFIVNGHDLAAALLWDDTNDHKLYVHVANADDGEFMFLISTADLTAGKMIFMVEYLMPSVLT